MKGAVLSASGQSTFNDEEFAGRTACHCSLKMSQLAIAAKLLPPPKAP